MSAGKKSAAAIWDEGDTDAKKEKVARDVARKDGEEK